MPNECQSVCLFKLGGSLLTDRHWPTRLQRWLVSQPEQHFLGIVGGGQVIEAMRELDRCHKLDPQAMHWRCVQMLDTTLDIANELTPAFSLVTSREELDEFLSSSTLEKRCAWLRISSFYHQGLDDRHLPADWDTTSDAIALWLAARYALPRVVLFKSCKVEHVTSLDEAVSSGVIDKASSRLRHADLRFELVQL
jgi:5-(aminomethyl)-3-furanmethanol phosphate kinase